MHTGDAEGVRGVQGYVGVSRWEDGGRREQGGGSAQGDPGGTGHGDSCWKAALHGGVRLSGISPNDALLYLCSVVSGTLELKEHESARWLSADGLESVDWLPADLQILPLINECL